MLRIEQSFLYAELAPFRALAESLPRTPYRKHSRSMMNFPKPDAHALAHSDRLRRQILAKIAAKDGFLSFYEFMRMALYEPGLGYYVAGSRKFGPGGDFVTAPEVSALFSQCLARQCAEVLKQLGGGSILELGAGSGVMAADILTELERLETPLRRYFILEVSPDLRARQRDLLAERVPHWLPRIEWLETLDGLALQGIVLANEVLDAMPVERFAYTGQGFEQCGVTQVDGQLAWAQRAAPPATLGAVQTLFERYGAHWAADYRSEFNPQLGGWFASLFEALQLGVLIFIDYGYPGGEYYHPQRTSGTVIAHYQHRATEALLERVGLQDVTANVDFTAVADAALAAGFELDGYTTQAYFLLPNGLDTYYQAAVKNVDEATAVMLSQQVRQLTLPAEMGERFQVIAFSKEYAAVLRGFTLQDHSGRL